MKKLILLIFLLCSLGINSQELALSEYGGTSSSSEKEHLTKDSETTDFVEHLDGLNDKKLDRYLRKRGVKDKLIAKGNDYFDKMWYAEAARIFDLVLEKTDAEHSQQLLSRAGDSHYYAGNLEKAYQWYHELHRLYKNEMEKDAMFKYTQILKGTGKYQRAASLTKILRQKREEPLKELDKMDTTAWEVIYNVSIKNLEINSPYSDFSPMFHHGSDIVYASAKDTSFLTTRRYRWTNQPFLDLYVAHQKGAGGDLSPPEKFSRKINTKYHEASMAFSPDQKTIYFTRNNYGKRLKRGENGINHLKIYRSEFKGDEWTKAEELPFNSENYSTGHPAVSPDGTKMYFVSDRPGGYGETDIYVVDIDANGAFSEPKNLGETINTEAKEMFPYATENALYFSSNRPMGLGGLDVYKSNGTNGVFSVGVNLGEPINSNRDDFSYIIDASGKHGYFASNRKGGKGDDDIYSFTSIPNFNSIVGSIASETSETPLENASIVLYGKDGALLNKSSSDATGRYVFKNLIPSTDYTVVAAKNGFVADTLSVRTKDNENISVSQYLKEVIKEKPITEFYEPSNVYFAFDSYAITPTYAQELDKLITVLKENETLSLKIESHTDAIGPEAYNKYLSDRRAKSTRDYIVSQGIDSSRILSAVGYGEERLLNNCSNGIPCAADQHRMNRRSEFILVTE